MSIVTFSAQTITSLGRNARIGLAVSGGSDSLAMMHAFAEARAACLENKPELLIASVDHQLRAEAGAEARFVAQCAARLGLRHQVLLWRGADSYKGNLMDAARRARYQLLAEWAKAENITHIGVAHTQDDQAECFLMGIARAAGIDGLSGMRPLWRCDGVVFFRPFLAYSRADLREYLRLKGETWLEDPTNEDIRYDRVRMRNALTLLRDMGLGGDRFALVSTHLAQAQKSLMVITQQAALDIIEQKGGALFVRHDDLAALAPEILRRLVQQILLWFSGADYGPRSASVERFAAAALNKKGHTLWGCRLMHLPNGKVLFMREANAISKEQPKSHLWDHRWRLPREVALGHEVRALGRDGLAQVTNWKEETNLPYELLLVSPSLWSNGKLISAPVAGVLNDWDVLSDSFVKTLAQKYDCE